MDRKAGFTLIELLVTIALIAIFAAIAVPSYRNLTADNAITSGLNALAGTLAEARSEAVSRGVDVMVCPSANATSASPSCASNGWNQGWITFVDADHSSTYNAGDTLLRVHGPVGGGVTINTVTSGVSSNHIVFDRMGFARRTFGNTGKTNLTIVACRKDQNLYKARGIVLTQSGTVQTATDRNGDGKVDMGTADGASSTDVTCS